ncbi:predicted protein [Naegleria gruberi]|uniref:Predicted protein n=1 Tax=Naegleria gruberi TaxID=5762 RepID=D2V8F8_NAEGR|nr:uncharacterized protein NAEGRDRAFT_65140 [Naegleria gruberi]EFC46677.1 predicted protein [Naegleria gruberi]|eukprot:XP_002679421.1 predicted protein [Naegleria gruberi strain NEG-M]
MYELMFEESPYLNHKSQKIYRFITPNTNTENPFNIPTKVVKGLRPTIPFSSLEEQYIWIEEFVLPREPEMDVQIVSNVFSLFIDLMIECWSGKAQERPDFGEISERLGEMLRTL